jgi:hypothetical protein
MHGDHKTALVDETLVLREGTPGEWRVRHDKWCMLEYLSAIVMSAHRLRRVSVRSRCQLPRRGEVTTRVMRTCAERPGSPSIADSAAPAELFLPAPAHKREPSTELQYWAFEHDDFFSTNPTTSNSQQQWPRSSHRSRALAANRERRTSVRRVVCVGSS